MYQEDNKKVDWVKVFLRLIIVLLLFILLIKLVSIVMERQETKRIESNMSENLKVIEETAKSYFTEDKLPKEIGMTSKVYLSTLIDEKILDPIVDEDKNTCDMDKSYISITKLDTEYQLKSYLECEKSNDYLNSFIEIETETTTTTKEVETTTKTTTKKTTTKTTKKKYTVGFNTNGGDYIEEIQVQEGKTIPYVEPVRKGYQFVGWYYQGKAFDFDTKVKQDYVLVAKWTEE